MLIGSYSHQLDAKNRFRIPAKFKSFLGDNLVITKGTENCLFIFFAEELNAQVFEKAKSISLFNLEAQKSLRMLLSSAHEAEQDNQGRILLPSALKKFAEIDKKIVFVGVGSRIEVWAEEKWESYTADSNFDKDMAKLADLGV